MIGDVHEPNGVGGMPTTIPVGTEWRLESSRFVDGSHNGRPFLTVGRMTSPAEEIVEVGAPESGAGPARGPRWWMVAVPLVLAVSLAVVVPGSDAPPEATIDPSQLQAPDAPIVPGVAVPAPDEPSPKAAAVGAGWQEVHLSPDTFAAPTVAHGDRGWLAVTSGRLVVARHSEDGSTWRTVTLSNAPMNGRPAVAVGNALMLVLAPSMSPASGGEWWLNEDGRTWTPHPFDVSLAEVDDLVTVGDHALLLGNAPLAAGSFPVPADPVLLHLGSDRRWVELPWPQGDVEITTLLAAEDSIWAYGQSEGEPARWRLEDGRLLAEDLSIHPGALPFRAILDGFEEGGWLGASFDATYVSTDLVTWIRRYPVGVRSGWTPAMIDGSLAMVAENAAGTDVVTDAGMETVPIRGRAPQERIVGLVSGDDVSVLSLDSLSGHRQLFRGAEEIAVTTELAPGGTWTTRDEVEVGPSAVAVGRSAGVPYVWTGQSLHAVDVEAGVIDPRPAVLGVGAVFTDAEGELHPVVGSRVYTATRSGLWSSRGIDVAQRVSFHDELPMGEVVLAQETGTLLRKEADESWEPLDTPGDVVRSAHVVADGLLIVVGDGATGSTTAHYSTDGLSWEPLSGRPGMGRDGGIPFLVMDDGQTIDLVDTWPIERKLELPRGVGTPEQVLAVDDGFRVRTSGAVLTGDGSEPWRIHPLDAEHGAAHDVVTMLPGGPLQVVTASPRGLSVLVWE